MQSLVRFTNSSESCLIPPHLYALKVRFIDGFTQYPERICRRLLQSLAVALVQAENERGAFDWSSIRHIVLLGVWVRDAVLLLLMDGLP
jgi:hypothetical protein